MIHRGRGRGGRSFRSGGRRGGWHHRGGKSRGGVGKKRASATAPRPEIQVVEVVGVRYLVAKEGAALRRLPPAAQKAAGEAAATAATNHADLTTKVVKLGKRTYIRTDENTFSVEGKDGLIPEPSEERAGARLLGLQTQETRQPAQKSIAAAAATNKATIPPSPNPLVQHLRARTAAPYGSASSNSKPQKPRSGAYTKSRAGAHAGAGARQQRPMSNQSARPSYCMFYSRTGQCNAKSSCQYVHDPTKVAVCLDFINGECVAEQCFLSHKIEPDKMPTCFRFIRGMCTDKACPYRHVMVSRTASVCNAFLKGYCPHGTKCTKKHVAPKRVCRSNDSKSEGDGNIDHSDGDTPRKAHSEEHAYKTRRDSSDVQMPRSFMKGSTRTSSGSGSGSGDATGSSYSSSSSRFVLGLPP